MNTYIKWFIKLASFFVIFILFDYLVGLTFNHIKEKACEKSPQAMIVDYSINKVNEDILIFGASEAAHSYVPQILKDSLQMSVYDCGNDGKPAYYHVAIINSIINRYNPKLIIWSVSPMWLAEDNNDRLSVLNPYYNDVPECREIVNKKSKYEPFKCFFSSYRYNSLLYDYLSCIIVPKTEFEYGHYLPLYGTDTEIIEQNRNLEEVFRFSPDLATEFDKTLELCKRKKIKVALVFTPRYEKSQYSHLRNYECLKEIAYKNDALLIEDLYRNPEINKPIYYKDFAHLNDDGAKLFTSMLASKLKDYVR